MQKIDLLFNNLSKNLSSVYDNRFIIFIYKKRNNRLFFHIPSHSVAAGVVSATRDLIAAITSST